MTDNRTTELLRKLLEERGVSCQTDYLHASWRVGPKLYDAMDNLDGTLTVDNLTHEQAIAATLGSDTCSMEYGGDVTESTKRVLGVYFCSECGSPIYNDCMPYYCMYCGRKVVRA